MLAVIQFRICFLLFSSLETYKKLIILPVVLYGCEVSSLILMEETGLKVFKKMLPRVIFGYK
jgi:hypothetical protein